MAEEHPLIAKCIADESTIGAGDESKCLPGWLNEFANHVERGSLDIELSKHGYRALFHTLLAARQRARRLVKERDEARKLLEQADEMLSMAKGFSNGVTSPCGKEEADVWADQVRQDIKSHFAPHVDGQ